MITLSLSDFGGHVGLKWYKKQFIKNDNSKPIFPYTPVGRVGTTNEGKHSACWGHGYTVQTIFMIMY